MFKITNIIPNQYSPDWSQMVSNSHTLLFLIVGKDGIKLKFLGKNILATIDWYKRMI